MPPYFFNELIKFPNLPHFQEHIDIINLINIHNSDKLFLQLHPTTHHFHLSATL